MHLTLRRQHVETPQKLDVMQHNGATSSCANVSQLGPTTLGSLPTINTNPKNTYIAIDNHIKKESSTPLQTISKVLKSSIVEGSIPQ